MSLHVTQFYQAFPRISTASDKRWGEKAWARGYLLSPPVISQNPVHLKTGLKFHWEGSSDLADKC